VQRDLYALAASARGTPVETAYAFLEEPGEPARDRFGEPELAAARERTESVLERLAAGRFEVTDRPHRFLCHDCPARDRLCSHTRDAQMRDEPEPPIPPPPPPEERPTEREAVTAAHAPPDDGEAQLSLLGE
jgi:hypothetical protein